MLVTCHSLASRHWSFVSLSPSNQYPSFNPQTHIKGTLPQPLSQTAALQCVNAGRQPLPLLAHCASPPTHYCASSPQTTVSVPPHTTVPPTHYCASSPQTTVPPTDHGAPHRLLYHSPTDHCAPHRLLYHFPTDHCASPPPPPDYCASSPKYCCVSPPPHSTRCSYGQQLLPLLG